MTQVDKELNAALLFVLGFIILITTMCYIHSNDPSLPQGTRLPLTIVAVHTNGVRDTITIEGVATK